MRWVRGLDQAESGLKQNLIRSMLIPSALMVLMGLVVLTGAAGMLSAVAEDKKERVFEMLLASATPLDIADDVVYVAGAFAGPTEFLVGHRAVAVSAVRANGDDDEAGDARWRPVVATLRSAGGYRGLGGIGDVGGVADL